MCHEIRRFRCRHEESRSLPCNRALRFKKKKSCYRRLSQRLWAIFSPPEKCTSRTFKWERRRCDECRANDQHSSSSDSDEPEPKEETQGPMSSLFQNVRQGSASDGPRQSGDARGSTQSNTTLLPLSSYSPKLSQIDEMPRLRPGRESTASDGTLVELEHHSTGSNTLFSSNDSERLSLVEADQHYTSEKPLVTERKVLIIKAPPTGQFKKLFESGQNGSKYRKNWGAYRKQNESTDSLFCQSSAQIENRPLNRI